ncbi:MAG: PIN domain-containing protein [Cyanobacteria bacterium P01_E01_bin.6]
MSTTPPIILVLDISTLSATSTREWLGFSRAGACYIPQVVYEEMRFLYERSPDPDLERVARDFNRFYATSGWNITEVVGHHTILKSATGYALTKRMRVALAVARCAYGLAEQHPKSLVILVASDRAILQRLYDIQAPNLAGIPGSALLQWSKTGQRPIAVSQKLQQLKMSGTLEPISSTISYSHYPTSTSRSLPQGYASRPEPSRARSTSINRQSSTNKRRHKSSNVIVLPEWLPQAISMVLAVVAISLAGYVLWLIFYTDTFDRFLPTEPQAPSTDTSSISQ